MVFEAKVEVFVKNNVLAILLLVSFSASAQLTRAEETIVKNIEKNYDESVAFLEKTVNINGGTYNVEGGTSVSTIYKDILDELGFTTRVNASASDLIAEIKGRKGKRLLLIGHIDGNSLTTNQGTVAEGNMIMLYALRAIKQAGLLKNRQVIVVLHSNESDASQPRDNIFKDLIEASKRSDIALCFGTCTDIPLGTVAESLDAIGEVIDLDSMKDIEKRVAIRCYKITSEKTKEKPHCPAWDDH